MHRIETHERDDQASNVVPLFPGLAAWEPFGDVVAAVVMRCRDRITVIERQPEPREGEERNSDCQD